jgi:hypothetical protein
MKFIFILFILVVNVNAQVSNFTMQQFGAYGDGIHDDMPAFTTMGTFMTSFEATNNAFPFVSLITTNGNNNFKWATSAHFLAGISNLITIDGTGGAIINATTAGQVNIGDSGFYQDNLHDDRILSVTNGATSVTLSNTANYTRYIPGQYACISGIDLQGFGYPPNWAIFEFVQITSSSVSSIGISSLMTVNGGLKNFYEATWPWYGFGDGTHIDSGGPATIYACRPTFNTEVTWQNVKLIMNGQSYINGLGPIAFSNVDYSAGNNMFTPSQNHNWWASSVTWGASASPELDKEIDILSFTNCTGPGYLVQSSSINKMNIVNSGGTNRTQLDYTNITGLTGDCYLSGVAVSNLALGPTSYGGRCSVYITNCIISNLVPNVTVTSPNGVLTNNGIWFVSYTNGGPVTWATPYSLMSWWGSGGHYSDVGRILDMWQDVNTNTYIQTDRPSGFALGQPEAYGVTNFTIIDSIGSSYVVGLCNGPSSNIFGTFAQITYQTNINSTSSPNIFVIGQLREIIANVITPYTGAQGTMNLNFMNQFGFSAYGQNAIYRSGGSASYNPVIKANNAGVRYIYPDTIIGAQSGDSATSTGGYLWFGGGGGTPGSFQLYCNLNISAEASNLWPYVTISWYTSLTDTNWYWITSPSFLPIWKNQ